jgi:hypothetical protein
MRCEFRHDQNELTERMGQNGYNFLLAVDMCAWAVDVPRRLRRRPAVRRLISSHG